MRKIVPNPSDETSSTAHPRQLKRAERFKKFITKEEIKSIPSFLSIDDEDEKIDDEFYLIDSFPMYYLGEVDTEYLVKLLFIICENISLYII